MEACDVQTYQVARQQKEEEHTRSRHKKALAPRLQDGQIELAQRRCGLLFQLLENDVKSDSVEWKDGPSRCFAQFAAGNVNVFSEDNSWSNSYCHGSQFRTSNLLFPADW